MNTAVLVEGVVKPDGTLEIPHKVDLPAGRVQVAIKLTADVTQPDRFWKMMESIWADLRASGRNPRTREEIDTEIDALRNEADEEMQAVERLQDDYRGARERSQRQDERAAKQGGQPMPQMAAPKNQ